MKTIYMSEQHAKTDILIIVIPTIVGQLGYTGYKAQYMLVQSNRLKSRLIGHALTLNSE